MVRLFKFIRKDVLTDIGGNIYHLKDIIPILDRLSHFGLTVTPIYVKNDTWCEENRKRRKIYNDSYHKRDELYDIIEKKYAGVVAQKIHLIIFLHEDAI